MAPSTSDYAKVPRAGNDLDAPGSEDSDSDNAAQYTGRAKRRSLAEADRSRFDAETLDGHEEVERLLIDGGEKRRSSKRSRGELRRMEQGGKSETSSISGSDESPVRTRDYTRKVS
jgi:CelD/BcsL family acetyltransferase involved in cellulose biosynthesis